MVCLFQQLLSQQKGDELIEDSWSRVRIETDISGNEYL